MFKTPSWVLVIASLAIVAGCSTVPEEPQERTLLKSRAEFVVQRTAERNPGLKYYLDTSAGYAVFPTIGKGGFIFAGGYGKGVLFEHGKMAGYCDATQVTAGAQIGGQSYSELVFFQTPQLLGDFKVGEYAFKAQVEAIALDQDASKRAPYHDGIAVFIMDSAGLMAEAAAGGQKFRFVPGE
jgi:lipid-binding SYLF domain-containing protein